MACPQIYMVLLKPMYNRKTIMQRDKYKKNYMYRELREHRGGVPLNTAEPGSTSQRGWDLS